MRMSSRRGLSDIANLPFIAICQIVRYLRRLLLSHDFAVGDFGRVVSQVEMKEYDNANS